MLPNLPVKWSGILLFHTIKQIDLPRCFYGMRLTKSFIISALFVIALFTCHKKTDEPDKKPSGNNDTTGVDTSGADTTSTDVPDNPVYMPVAHDIQIENYLGKRVFWNEQEDEQFIPRGVNYFWIISTSEGLQDRFFGVGIFDEARTRSDFQKLRARGYNTVRYFLDNCNGSSVCIGNTNGKGLNGEYIDNIARTMEIAHEEGIYLMLTSNDLPDDGGYWDLSNQGANDQFAGYRNAHYLTVKGIESAQLYWHDLLSALQERSARFEAVLAWSILNEQFYFGDQPPFSLTSGTVTCANGKTYDMSGTADKKQMALEGITNYIDSVRSVIDNYDPNALVTMGFFVPDYPNPMRSGDSRYVETAGLLAAANLDYFDFHAYPGEDPIDNIAENFGVIGYTAKPVMMGEFGAFIDRYSTVENAAETIQEWMAQSCQLGFDGWLYWGLYRAPEAIGDATWGFYDADSEMFDILAPSKYPDPCDKDLLPPVNIALNATSTASAFISGQEPAKAVDGSSSTNWGAGDFPPQWLQIDLGQEYDVGTIKLVVGQYPDGATAHTLEAKSATGTWELLKNFSQTTNDNDVLTYQSTTANSFRYIRITTTSSPSWVAWKEVEVNEK